MDEKDYVSFETALTLKNAGFNYPCQYYIGLRLEDFPSVTWENSPKKVKVTIELEGK